MATRLKHITKQLTTPPKRRMSSSSPIQVAILDDYQSIAPAHFQRLSGIKVDSFPETLQMTKLEDVEAQVKRLQPYQVISTMRERTAFLADLQKRLPTHSPGRQSHLSRFSMGSVNSLNSEESTVSMWGRRSAWMRESLTPRFNHLMALLEGKIEDRPLTPCTPMASTEYDSGR